MALRRSGVRISYAPPKNLAVMAGFFAITIVMQLKWILIAGTVVATFCLYANQTDRGHFILPNKMSGYPKMIYKPDSFPLKVRLDNGNTLLINGGKAEIYNPITTQVHKIIPPRYWGHSTITKLKNGKILLTGGSEHPFSLRWFTLFSNCEFPSAAEIFDPKSNTFRKTGSLNIARENHTATLLNDGTVLITGGQDCTSCDSGDNLCNGTPPAELYIPAQ